MKKLALTFIILCIFILTPAYSFEMSPKSEIKQVLKEYKKAIIKHDTEKIKSFYDKNYKSADGFGVDSMAEMLDKTYSTYENIKYKIKVNSINAYENWALVQLSDYTTAVVYPVEDKDLKKEKMGKLEGNSVYNLYLTKENDEWKIIKDEILIEETSLKYGVARKTKMHLVTPYDIKNGEQYDISLKMDKIEDIIALASISREEIVYPPSDYNEKFRKIPEVGELERVVRANDKNLNEYAIASVGLTKVSFNQKTNRAKIEILGLAYLMKRINMNKPIIQEEILVENNWWKIKELVFFIF